VPGSHLNPLTEKTTVLTDRGGCRGDLVLLLLISHQVSNLVGSLSLHYLAIRSNEEAVLIYLGVAGEGGD